MSYGLNVEMHKQVSERGDPKLLERRDGPDRGRQCDFDLGLRWRGVTVDVGHSFFLRPWAFRHMEQR